MIIGSLQTTLGDLVESGEGFIQTGPFGSQLHAHDYVENGIPIVMPQQLGDNEISEYGISQINGQDRARLIRHVMRVGDIVFSRRGDVTRRAYITGKEDGWLCGTGCLLLRLNHPQCDNSYLVRFLGLHETRSYLTQHAIGATMPNLNQRILASVPVVLPPREHQERIIGVVSAYDDLIENNRRRIRLLEQAARLLYKEWFVHLRFPGHEHVKIKDGVPKGWTSGVIGNLGEIVTGKTPSKKKASYYGGDVPFIKTPDMHGNSIVTKTEENLSDEGASSQATKMLPPRSILVSCIGTVGIVALNASVAQTNQQINAIIPRTDLLRYWSFFMAETLRPLLEGVGGGATMPNINKSKFSAVPVVIPSRQILDQFSSVVAPNIDQIEQLTVMNDRLARARDLLLPRLMNGEITI